MTGTSHQNTRENPLEPLWNPWWECLEKWRVGPELARQEFARLVQSYGTAGRYYHTLAHVQQVLDTITQLRDYAHQPEIVELAGWFHDVVYDPQATDNESQSADYAAAMMRRLGWPPRWVLPVQRLIGATRSHPTDTQNPDIQVLLDADLAILGSPPAQYAAYAQAIRQEYAWVPDDAYRQGRSQILRKFLQRPSLYFTPPMQAIAPQAQINLQTELQNLQIPLAG
jgi:predicted metal-dependent HD superfamily phosphohydrolase